MPSVKYVLTVTVLTLAATLAHANEMHNILTGFSLEKRNGALGTILTRSGEACTVTRSFFQGFDKQQNAFWSVSCTSGKDFSMMLYNDTGGTVTLTDCKVLRALAKHDCFKKL